MKDSTNKQPGLLEGYKNERLFQAFFENSQSLLCMHDLTGKFIIVNKTGSLMSGYDPEELTNMSVFDIIPEDRHRELNETKQSLKKKMDEEDLEALNKLGHNLKGTSLTAGLTELCKLAVAFEMLGELDKNYTEDLLEKTNNEITIVVNMLTEGGDS